MKIAFITNFCPHYRIKTFEVLSQYYDVDFYFFSAGDEWYWQQSHGKFTGKFNFLYLQGFKFFGTRITPTLPGKLFNVDYDVIIKCITGRFTLPISYLIARIKQKPFILWTGIWMRLQTPVHRLIFPLTKYIYRHANAIVVYGDHVKRYLIDEGIPEERIFSTTHAVDNEFYCQAVPLSEQKNLYEKLKIPENHKIILYLGRLESSKGLSFLIEAFTLLNHKDILLVLAGEGSYRKFIEMQIAKLGIIDRIRFTGYIPTQETLPYYSISTLFVLPSITTPQGKETWGLVVNEAFNQGLPVVATDAVGAAAGGLVEDGINGFIVPERDSKALAEAICKILDNPNLREQMSKNARKKISHWDNEKMIMGFREAIEYVSRK